MPQVTVTTILTYKMTYLVDTKEAPTEYALDSITMEELEEWKQEPINEQIIGVQEGWVDTTVWKDRGLINGATYTWDAETESFIQSIRHEEL